MFLRGSYVFHLLFFHLQGAPASKLTMGSLACGCHFFGHPKEKHENMFKRQKYKAAALKKKMFGECVEQFVFQNFMYVSCVVFFDVEGITRRLRLQEPPVANL